MSEFHFTGDNTLIQPNICEDPISGYSDCAEHIPVEWNRRISGYACSVGSVVVMDQMLEELPNPYNAAACRVERLSAFA